MIVTCPQCATKFDVDDACIPERGAKARCSRCRHVFELQRTPPAGQDSPEPRAGRAERAHLRIKISHRKSFWAAIILILILGGALFATREIWNSLLDLQKAEAFLSTWKKYVGLGGGTEGTFTLEKMQGYELENAHLGKIFVVEGRAVSHWKEPRSFLRVRGTLLDARGAKIEEKIVYCGNLLSEKDLKEMDREAIAKSLSSQFGESLSNVNIRPNQSIPFMVVFTDAPSSLPSARSGGPSGKAGNGPRPSDFVVEVVGSQKGSK